MGDFANRQMTRGSEQPPLHHITFYDHNARGLDCRHCSAGPICASNGSHQSPLPSSAILSAVREALPLGLRTVQFSGGKILQHPEITTLLEQLEALNLGIIMETDGTGLTAELAQRLAGYSGYQILLGLDGTDAATHDSLHEHGSYEKVIQALEYLNRAGQLMQIVFTVQRNNLGQIMDMVRLAEQSGASSLRFVTPRPSYANRSNGNGHFNSLPSSETLAVEELIALGWRVERKMAPSTSVRLFFDQPPVFRGLHPNAPIEDQGLCNILTSLAVLNSGEYAICGLAEHTPELIFGKISSDALAQIWSDHPILRTLRSGLPTQLQGICDRCSMKTSCLGNCPVENYMRTGSFFGAYWFCEAADRAGLFPAGRLIENYW